MLFNSLTFVAFFSIVLVLHYLPFSWRVKKFNLLIASYLFYAAWNPPFILLLWLSTIIDWFAANSMHRSKTIGRRRFFLLLSLVTNLGLLSYFKYGGFLMENFVYFAEMVGIHYQAPAFDIFLPVGISFYTFQTLSYTIDVYRKTTQPAESFLDFALFVTFFPQLVAGPIMRSTEFIPQCIEPQKATGDQFMWGLFMLSLGLFEKVVLADGMVAPAAEAVFGFPGPLNPLDAWAGTLAFTAQIFCDFAGYSTCAIGTALCLGFRVPNNFRFPYAAIGFSDFWERWHISLSRWLRDYLYIGLGGNRKGIGRTRINLMLTMLIGGLWHGAAWQFVVWGGIHGSYLIIERLLRKRWGGASWASKPWGMFTLAMVTFFFTVITWVFFRATDLSSAWGILVSMFGFVSDGAMVLATLDIVKVFVVMVGILATHWYMRDKTLEGVVSRAPWWGVGFVWAVMVILVILMQGGGDAFLYFQF